MGSAEVCTAPVPAMVPYRAVTGGTPGFRITCATIWPRTSTEGILGIPEFLAYDEI